MFEMVVAETKKTPVEVTASVIPFWKRLLTDTMLFFKLLHRTHIPRALILQGNSNESTGIP